MTGRRQLTLHHAQLRTLTSDVGPLAALDTGLPAGVEPGEHPTLLMLPGFTGAKEDFAPLLDPLAEQGVRAIAVDLPGQHESPGPADEDAYSVPALAATVVQVLAGMPGPVVLLGHSFGGLVARAAVLGGARIAGLVLLCSGPARLPDGPREQAVRTGEPILRGQGVEAAWQVRAAVTAGLRAPFDDDIEAYYRRRFVASSVPGLLGMGAALLAEPDRVAELAEALGTSGIGVSVIAGEADDAWSPAEQADMARRLGTWLTIIPAAAHSPAVEQPDSLGRLLLREIRQFTAAAATMPGRLR